MRHHSGIAESRKRNFAPRRVIARKTLAATARTVTISPQDAARITLFTGRATSIPSNSHRFSRDKPMETQDIFQTLKDTLVEQFELDPAKITPEARLYEDLDLDSIDAVDMIIKLQELTGCKVSPEDFKEVRTVGDVERVIGKLLAARG